LCKIHILTGGFHGPSTIKTRFRFAHPHRDRSKGIAMKPLVILSTFFFFGILAFSQDRCFAFDQESLPALETRLSTTLVLSDLLTYAYLSNPSITSSKKSWQVFIENYRIGKSYPDPQLMTTFFPNPIETRLGPQDWNLTLSQAIPFPGTLTRKGKVLEADVRIARLKVDKTMKEIVQTISTSFYELIYIQRAITIAKANLGLNQKLMAISQNAYARDKALFYDVSKAQAQTAQIQYDILLLLELAQTEKAKLNTRLNRSPDSELGRTIEILPRQIAYSLNEIYDLAMMHQEDILIANEIVQKSEEAIGLAKYENLPSFKLGLFYAGIGQPDVATPPKDAGDDSIGIQLGLNLPLWFGKNRSRTAKAFAVKEKAKADKLVTANMIKARISRFWFKLQNSKRLISLYEEQLLPQALSSVQTAETWFRQGQGNFADYLEVQATAYNFQLSLERAKADYGKTLVQLEQLAGVILDTKKIDPKGENKS
jgi:cobalt-zinc-cadmium efflux system outer membrane protein